MTMRIANTISDSIVDGVGLRYTIFTQGCPHHCPGCHNPDTHDPAGGREITVAEIAQGFLHNPLLRGITLSGGDPFVQAEDCAQLAELAHSHGLDVWVYSGYTYEHLLKEGTPAQLALLAGCDVLVDGLFLQARKSYEALFRGSDNQRLIDLKASRTQGKTILWQRVDPLAHFTVPES